MHTLPFVMALLTSGIIGLACVAQAPAPKTTPAPTINIQATVAFLVKAELATVIPPPSPPPLGHIGHLPRLRLDAGDPNARR